MQTTRIRTFELSLNPAQIQNSPPGINLLRRLSETRTGLTWRGGYRFASPHRTRREKRTRLLYSQGVIRQRTKNSGNDRLVAITGRDTALTCEGGGGSAPRRQSYQHNFNIPCLSWPIEQKFGTSGVLRKRSTNALKILNGILRFGLKGV